MTSSVDFLLTRHFFKMSQNAHMYTTIKMASQRGSVNSDLSMRAHYLNSHILFIAFQKSKHTALSSYKQLLSYCINRRNVRNYKFSLDVL